MILTHGANGLPRGGGGMTVNIGGREYPIVQIGNQVWLAENLDYKWPGLAIGGVAYDFSPHANYYNNDSSTYGVDGLRYGLLYNRAAILYLESNKTELLPSGWRVPSRDDLNVLVDSVSGDASKLKSTSGWVSGNGDNSTGFAAVPSGYNNAYAYYENIFVNIGSMGYYGSITGNSSIEGKALSTNNTVASISVGETRQLALRLIKDA